MTLPANGNSLSSQKAIVIDTSAPTASVSTAMVALGSSVGTAQSNETGTVYLVKDGASVADRAALEADVSANTARKAAVTAVNTDTSIDTTGLAAGSYHTYAVDAAGNVSAASSNAVTLAAVPTVASIVRDGAATTNATSVDFTVTFSEAVNGVTTDDFTATATSGTVSATGITVTGSGTTYSVAVTGLSGEGTLRLDLNASGTAITADSGGVAIASGYTAGQSYTRDVTAPTTSVSTCAFDADTGASSSDFITRIPAQTISGTLSATVASGETVNVSLDNGSTWAAATATVGQNTWSLAGVTLTSSDTLKVKVSDLAGNDGAVRTQAYTLDTTAPTTSVSTCAFSADTGASGSDFITRTAAQTISGTLSANVANGETVYVSLDNGGTWAAATTTVGHNTWSLAGVALTSSNTLKVKVSDLAGNDGDVGTQAYTLDTTAPVTTLQTVAFGADTGASGSDFITRTAAQTISGTLSANVANGETVNVSLDNGSTWAAATTTVGQNTWSLAGVTLTSSNTLKVKVSDLAGNDGAVGTQAYTLDTAAPTATVALDDSALTAGETSGVTITFSEAVTGFTNADLTLANGSLSAVASSDGGTTWTATFTPNPNVANAATNVIALDMTGVADQAGNSGSGTASSANYTVNTAKVLAYSATTFTEAAANDGSISITSILTLSNDTFSTADMSARVSNVPAGLTASLVRTDATHATLSLAGKATAHANANDVANLSVTLTNADFTGGAAASVANAIRNDLVIDFTDPPSTGGGAAAPIADNDGVSSDVENAVPTIPPKNGTAAVIGDGNGDGIADSLQSGVTSVAFRDTTLVSQHPDAKPVYVTLVADSIDGKVDSSAASHATLNNVRQIDAPASKPADLSMPLGMISFSAALASAGATENFSLYVDSSVAANGYWKQTTSGGWVNLASAAYGGKIVSEGGKTRLDFKLTDGGQFDADGKADGVVTDPGAIGYRAAAVSSDSDQDQFPDSLEAANGLTVGVRDNNVYSGSKLFVMELYRDILYREADSDGLAYWQERIDSGSLSKAAVASAFLQSGECQQGAAALARLYFGAFARHADADGLKYWVAQSLAGDSLSTIGKAFVASTEFAATYGSLDNRAFVEQLYQNALGRSAEKAGLDYWLAQLQTGASRGEIVAGVTGSAECRAAMAAKVDVTLDYIGLLGRTPDTGGYAYWLDQENSGTTPIGVIGQFIATTEYHDRFLPSSSN